MLRRRITPLKFVEEKMLNINTKELKKIIGGAPGGPFCNSQDAEASFWYLAQGAPEGGLVLCQKGEVKKINKQEQTEEITLKAIEKGTFVPSQERADGLTELLDGNTNPTPAELCAAAFEYDGCNLN